MYNNYNGSEIIYVELISGRVVAIFAAAYDRCRCSDVLFVFSVLAGRVQQEVLSSF